MVYLPASHSSVEQGPARFRTAEKGFSTSFNDKPIQLYTEGQACGDSLCIHRNSSLHILLFKTFGVVGVQVVLVGLIV